MARQNHINGLFAKLAKADRAHLNDVSVIARWAVVELTWAYWPDCENPIELSERTLADMVGCDRKTARRVIRELVERGFLVRERKGEMRGAKAVRAAWYRMTWLDVGRVPKTGTFEYRMKKTNGGKVTPSTGARSARERGNFSLVETAAQDGLGMALNANEVNGSRVSERSTSQGPAERTYSNSPTYNSTGAERAATHRAPSMPSPNPSTTTARQA